MPIESWTGRFEFDTTHEMVARSRLIDSLTRQFQGSPGLVAAVFDFSCGEDLDLAIIKQDAIVVVELKECSAAIEGGENGEWRIMNGSQRAGVLAGGVHGNPYRQVRDYRYAPIRYLGDHSAEFLPAQKASQAKFGHVSGIVATSPALHSDSRLDFDFGRLRWFHVVGLPELAERIHNIRTTEIRLSDEEIRRLVGDVLRCTPISPPESQQEITLRPADLIDWWAAPSMTYYRCTLCGRLLGDTYCEACQASFVQEAACTACPFCMMVIPETDLLVHLLHCDGRVDLYEPNNQPEDAQTIASEAEQVREFCSDDDGYLTWLLDHPRSFVLNTTRSRSPSYMVLHRAACPLIRQYSGSAERGGFTERQYIKIVAEDVAALKAWVMRHGRPDGSFSSVCGHCKPA